MSERTSEHADVPSLPEASLPSITLPMLMDFLRDYEVLRQPASMRRVFHWIAAASRDDLALAVVADVPDAHLLFVCQDSSAEDLLRERPSACALVLVAEGDDALLERLDAYRDRVVAIRRKDRFSYFAFLLQSYFTRLLVWENELSRIALRKESLTDMLDAGATMLGNFMFVSDGSFNVIARTESIDPPDELHRRIIDTGCLTPHMINEKRQRLPEKAFYLKQPSSLTPYARLSHPIYLNHTYLGSLSMSCNATPLTEGLKDLFSILIRHMAPLFESRWRAQMRLNIPQYFFFAKLLEHAPVTEDYVRSQLELASLDTQCQFKLVVFEVDEAADPERAALVVRAAAPLNQGCALCFAHKNDVLALCYAPPSDNRLSHQKTVEDLQTRVCASLGVDCGVSEIFEDITDLDLAYRQAKLALGLKEAIKSELFATDEEAEKHVYLFGEALLYFLVDPSPKDERFVRFCFSHSVLQKIYEEDRESGTNYLALFWFYLHSQGNATAVSQKMHLHRNTVLYHIEKMQKRFGFDLSAKSARDRMLLDFKVFFLTESHASIEKIFCDTRGEGDAQA